MGRDLGLDKVVILNDLKAIGYAVPYLQKADLHTISPCRPDAYGAVAAAFNWQEESQSRPLPKLADCRFMRAFVEE